MLCRDFPTEYATVEKARASVRYYRGANGVHGRKAVSITVPRVAIPKPEDTQFGVVDLPAAKKWVIFADTHIPFHDPVALKTIVKRAKKDKCDGVIILGDFMDCYKLSRWLQDPTVRDFKKELQTAGQVLRYIAQEIGPKHVLWKYGNHELRSETYLLRNAPELFGVVRDTVTNLPELMRALVAIPEDLAIQVVGARKILRHHKLYLLHGHEVSGLSSCVNPAYGAYRKLNECCMVAHRHSSSKHTVPTLERIISTWSVGCSCQLHPDWLPLNSWTQGFAILNTQSDWSVENFHIVDGQVK